MLDESDLVAVIARLEDPSHEDLVGCWVLEAAFGQIVLTTAPGRTFRNREAVERWIVANLAVPLRSALH